MNIGLAKIVAEGNMPSYEDGYVRGPNWILCNDGFTMSVIAGAGAYCQPRPAPVPGIATTALYSAPHNYPGPYMAVECGYLSEVPPDSWAEYCVDDVVYSNVPVELVDDLVTFHGGEFRVMTRSLMERYRVSQERRGTVTLTP